jgi:hypothetical protein
MEKEVVCPWCKTKMVLERSVLNRGKGNVRVKMYHR